MAEPTAGAKKKRPSSRCTVCAHPKRAAIDLAVAQGAHAVAVGKAYNLGRHSVARHRESCLPAKLARAGAERAELKNGTAVLKAVEHAQRAEQISAASVLDSLVGIQERTLDLLTAAERDGKTGDALRAVREARENLVVLGKLLGAFPREVSGPTIDARTQTIVNMPALQEMSPEDLRALIRALPSAAA